MKEWGIQEIPQRALLAQGLPGCMSVSHVFNLRKVTGEMRDTLEVLQPQRSVQSGTKDIRLAHFFFSPAHFSGIDFYLPKVMFSHRAS